MGIGAVTGLDLELSLLRIARDTLRLYAKLDTMRREALDRGQPLPVAQMTAAQQALFLRALRESTRLDRQPLDLGNVGAGRLVLTVKPFVRVATRRGDSVTYTLERPTAGAEASPPAPEPGVDRYPITRMWFELEYEPRMSVPVMLYVAASRLQTPR